MLQPYFAPVCVLHHHHNLGWRFFTRFGCLLFGTSMSGQRNTTWLQTREVTPDPHRCRDWIKFVSYFIHKGRQLQAARSQIVSQYVVRCTKTRQWWHLLAICQNCSSSSQGWYFSRKSHKTDPQCVAKRFLIFIMSKRHSHTRVYFQKNYNLTRCCWGVKTRRRMQVLYLQ